MIVSRGQGVGERIAKRCKVSFWDGNGLNLDCNNGYMTEYICQNSLNHTFKLVSFIICKSYFNKGG